MRLTIFFLSHMAIQRETIFTFFFLAAPEQYQGPRLLYFSYINLYMWLMFSGSPHCPSCYMLIREKGEQKELPLFPSGSPTVVIMFSFPELSPCFPTSVSCKGCFSAVCVCQFQLGALLLQITRMRGEESVCASVPMLSACIMSILSVVL